MADNHRVSKRLRNSAAVNKEEQSEITGKNLRKIRVICSDPEATDSSSDEEAESGDRSSTRRIVCEIVIGVKPEDDDEPVDRKDLLDQARRKKLTGVRLRKWGKWASEIRDPFSRKRIWLGTFNTAEEASKAYMAKKEEFQARISAQTRPIPGGVAPVHWKKSSRWREAVYDPVRETEVESGTYDSDPEEEALKALQSMKHAFVSGYLAPPGSESRSPLKSPKIEPLSGDETISGTTTTTTSIEDSREEANKPPWLGMDIDMLVIDNNGNLLGQFSRLDDDLKIY